MNLSLIVAVDMYNAMGLRGQLPWHIPSELRYFKELTLHNTLLVGSRTYEGLPYLPNRNIIVFSKTKTYDVPTVSSLDEALLYCQNEVFVAGGAQLYMSLLPKVSKVYRTIVQSKFEADTYFPRLAHDWKIIFQEYIKNPEEPEYCKQILIRKS